MQDKIKSVLAGFLNKQALISLGVGIATTLFFSKAIESIQKSKKIDNIRNIMFVGIELGGTNFCVAIGQPQFNLEGEIIDFKIEQKRNGITYENPNDSLHEIMEFINNKCQLIKSQKADMKLFIGIASFGPLCLNELDPKYGSITTTPKQLWRNIHLLNIFQQEFKDALIQIDTDVNACAYAEFKLGNHKVKDSLAYITVGTGVGVGMVSQKKTVHGLTHPEGGHIIVERSEGEQQRFEGVCEKHKGCLEGMVCNKAIAKRVGKQFTELHEISDDNPIWKIVGGYLAQLCLNITLISSPEIIVIGGGIMNRKPLYPIIRTEFIRLLNRYVEHPLFEAKNIEKYIVEPKLGSAVGVKGGMILKFME